MRMSETKLDKLLELVSPITKKKHYAERGHTFQDEKGN